MDHVFADRKPTQQRLSAVVRIVNGSAYKAHKCKPAINKRLVYTSHGIYFKPRPSLVEHEEGVINCLIRST